MDVITLEVGNTSWWKNRKYRREAANELKELRLKYKYNSNYKYTYDEVKCHPFQNVMQSFVAKCFRLQSQHGSLFLNEADNISK